MPHFHFKILRRKTDPSCMDQSETLLRKYLEKDSPISYGDHALETTVHDVFSMDSDLKEYVFHFLETGDTSSDIECECVSIYDLLQTRRFTPVTAALLIQWYRRDPIGAASFLFHHDTVNDIPEVLPETDE